MLSNCLKLLMICVSTMACTINDCNNLLNGKQSPDNNPSPELVNNMQAEAPKKKRRCCPYDFDSSICRTVGDRLLCGYNRNIGKPPSKDDEVRFNGCRIRGGRIECGYRDIAWTHGPYTNPRRPPPNDPMQPDNNPDIDDDATPMDTDATPIDISNSRGSNQLLVLAGDATKNPRNYGVTKCVEIDKRIVCRPI